jgi:GNAT superfamily N-acetyltransferase
VPFNIVEPRVGLGDACARILGSLTAWFGLPEATADYIAHVDSHPTWSAVDGDGLVVGILDVVRHFPESAEIHIMAVDAEFRGRGIGSALIAAAEAELRGDGARVLQVKTLAASHPDPGYAETRAFYVAQGFSPLEEVELWGPDNPALILVKPL